MALSRKQLALIHIAAKKDIGLTDEQYREVLRKMAGVESSKNLDQDGFELVMQGFAAMGYRSDFTKSFYGRRRGMAAPAACSRIRQLWREFAGGKAGEHSLDKWLERTFGVSALRFLTADQAEKALRALWSMRNRQKAEARERRSSA